MNKAIFTGVCTALVTPFRDGAVDETMLERLLMRQVEAGIPAVVLCGTTGEAPTLSDREKQMIFRRSVSTLSGKCKVIAGTGSNDTSHAAELSIAAQEAGADALLLVTPYYNKATDTGLITHYRTIAEQVRIPIILYNVPSRTGVDISLNVYKELAELPNIAGVKEASTDIRKLLAIVAQCPEHFSVWTGNDDMTVSAMSIGCRGVISVVSNLFPVHMKTMTRYALGGDYRSAAEIACRLHIINEILSKQVNPIPIKTAMKIIGYECGTCRLPLTPLEKEEEEALRQAIGSFPFPGE